MFFPLFWAEKKSDIKNRRGKISKISRYGWSDTSKSDAEQMASERLAMAITAYNEKKEGLSDGVGRMYDAGANGDSPIPEIVVKKTKLPSGQEYVISRNRYGAECLNVKDVVILDVDAAPIIPPAVKILSKYVYYISAMDTLILSVPLYLLVMNKTISLLTFVIAVIAFLITSVITMKVITALSTRQPDLNNKPDADLAQAQLDKALSEHAKKYPGDYFSIYRTRRGHRLILCSSKMSHNDLSRFNSIPVDPMYLNLCKLQHGFRARLTPKPWNMGLPAMQKYKITDLQSTDKHRNIWINEYNKLSAGYSVCHQVKREYTSNHDISAILSMHDELTVGVKKLA